MASKKSHLELLVFIFIISIISIEMSFGFSGRLFGTLLILLSSFFIISTFFINLRRSPVLISFTQSDCFFLLFSLLLVISCTWSLNPVETLFQACLWLLIWFSIKLISIVEIEVVLKQFIYISFFIALFSIILIPFLPGVVFQPKPSGEMPELRGLFHHQLRFGLFNSIALGMLVIMRLNNQVSGYLKNNFLYFTVFSVIAAALILSFARLYTFFAIISFSMIFIMSFKGWKRRILTLKILFLISLLIYFSDGLLVWLNSLGIDTTLTGRVRIWFISLDIADKNWLLGSGYSSFENSRFDYLWGLYRPAHPHNSFIQSYFELGIIGFIGCMLLIQSHYSEVLSQSLCSRLKYSYTTFLFFLTLLGSLTGANYASKPTFILCFFLLLFEICKEKKIKVYI